jgi:hypothetical protein
MTEQSERETELLAAQTWRSETPGHAGWSRTVRPKDTNKLFVLSADSHAVEPKDWMNGYIDDDVSEKLRVRRGRRDQEMDHERAEGMREPKETPAVDVDKVNAKDKRDKEASVASHLLDRSKMAGEDLERLLSGRYPDKRVEDNARDGVDAEIIFPGAAFLAAQIANDDPALAIRFCEGWNNWASDYPHPEGSWPHSPEAIERQMGRFSEEQRAKILAGNAARLLGIDIPF